MWFSDHIALSFKLYQTIMIQLGAEVEQYFGQKKGMFNKGTYDRGGPHIIMS